MAFPHPEGVPTYHNKAYPAIDVTRPELSADGKVVFITGGGSGIGLGIAEYFAKAGSKEIAITGRRENVLQDAKKKIEAAYPGTRVLALQNDIRDTAGVEAAMKQTKDTFGPINVLINNAAYLPATENLGHGSFDEWWLGFEVNAKGAYNFLSGLLKTSAPDATVINVVSGAVNCNLLSQTSYGSSKIATTKIFEGFQAENPGYRIVNIAPGIVDTPMYAKSMEPFDRANLPRLPLDDKDLSASFMVWASSPEAAFLKGRFAWVNWDVEELKAAVKREEHDQFYLTVGIHGMPNVPL